MWRSIRIRSNETPTPTAKAMLYGVRARVHAEQGDAQETDRFVGMAEEEFGRATPQHDPSWITWFDKAEPYGDTGHAYYTLALKQREWSAEAARRLTLAIDQHGPNQARSKALALIKLGKVRMVQRDPCGVGRF